MEALWNKSHLNRPPTTSWRPNQGEFDTPNFQRAINKALKDLSLQEALHNDAAVLSRLIYRMKSKFRSDKGLKSMEKMNRALLNYLHLSLEREYNNLRDNIGLAKNDTSLPSRQMLQYVLVRTQGFAKLMCRIESVAMSAAEYFKNRINLGQAWTMSVIAYLIISRIWILSRHFVQKSCDWYRNLYSFHGELKIVGVEWLPREYSLPKDLKTWLSVAWIDQDINCLAEDNFSSTILSSIKLGNEFENEDSIADNPDEFKSEKTFVNQMNQILLATSDLGQKISRESFNTHAETKKPGKKSASSDLNCTKTLDLGQKISRESLNSQAETKKPGSKKSASSDLNCIKTKKDLSKLLTLDSYSGFDKLQWNMMKKQVSKTIVKLNKCSSDKNKSKLLIDEVVQCLRSCMN